MSGDNRKPGPKSTAVLAALSQTPYGFVHGNTFDSMSLRWDQYLFLRSQGYIIEQQAGGAAPDVAITPLGVAAQTMVGTGTAAG